MADLDDLDADYRSAGFGGALGTGRRRALVLVDLVRAYLEPESPLYAGPGGSEVVAASARLLEVARAHHVTVVHTRVSLAPGGADGGLFARKVPSLRVFEVGSALAEPPDELVPAPDEVVVTKKFASAFFDTALASTLRQRGIDALVIGGASTSGCVRATALDAMQHGFIPLVVPQACLDRDARPHEAALFDLEAKYADLLDLGAAVNLLAAPTAQEGG
jgi:maleamate amidohydrolase